MQPFGEIDSHTCYVSLDICTNDCLKIYYNWLKSRINFGMDKGLPFTNKKFYEMNMKFKNICETIIVDRKDKWKRIVEAYKSREINKIKRNMKG